MRPVGSVIGIVLVLLAPLAGAGAGVAHGQHGSAAQSTKGSPPPEAAEGLALVRDRIDELRRLLALLQAEVNEAALQARPSSKDLARPERTAGTGSRSPWIVGCCATRLAEMDSATVALGDALIRLRTAYQAAGHVRGLALVGRLEARAQSLEWRLRELGGAGDAVAAGAGALHVLAALEALSQTVAEGHDCCRIRLLERRHADDGSGTTG